MIWTPPKVPTSLKLRILYRRVEMYSSTLKKHPYNRALQNEMNQVAKSIALERNRLNQLDQSVDPQQK